VLRRVLSERNRFVAALAWSTASLVSSWTTSLALFTTDHAGSGQHFAFLIPHEKAEQARRALVAQGFPEETMQQDDGLSVYVRDPDGNKIELYGKRSNA